MPLNADDILCNVLQDLGAKLYCAIGMDADDRLSSNSRTKQVQIASCLAVTKTCFVTIFIQIRLKTDFGFYRLEREQ